MAETNIPNKSQASYLGAKADMGRIGVGQQFPGEGYAVIRCGNTEVQVAYSLLHHLQIECSGESPVFAQLADLSNAMNSITCEASMGRNGDVKP